MENSKPSWHNKQAADVLTSSKKRKTMWKNDRENWERAKWIIILKKLQKILIKRAVKARLPQVKKFIWLPMSIVLMRLMMMIFVLCDVQDTFMLK